MQVSRTAQDAMRDHGPAANDSSWVIEALAFQLRRQVAHIRPNLPYVAVGSVTPGSGSLRGGVLHQLVYHQLVDISG